MTLNYHPSTEISTQVLAKFLPLWKNDTHIEVIYTFCQREGRGQGGNEWFCGEYNNIAATFVMEPLFMEPRHLFFLDMALSIGVLRYVKSRCPECALKWPNDIYWREQKAGGLLMETNVRAGKVERLYFGVGLNVNQEKFPDNLPRPCSFFQIDGKVRDLQNEVYALVERVQTCYMDFIASYKEKNWAVWKAEYLSSLLFKDQWREFIYKGKPEIACIRDVDEYGFLKLEKWDKTFIWADLKELRYGFDV